MMPEQGALFGDPPTVTEETGEEPVRIEDGVRVLEQDFEIPEGMLPVRIQVGDAPVTVAGWVAPGHGNIGPMLRNVADEVERIERGRDLAGS